MSILSDNFTENKVRELRIRFFEEITTDKDNLSFQSLALFFRTSLGDQRDYFIQRIKYLKKATHWNSIKGEQGICPDDGFCPECQKKDAWNNALGAMIAILSFDVEGDNKFPI